MNWIQKYIGASVPPPKMAPIPQTEIQKYMERLMAQQLSPPAPEPEPEPVATEVIGWRGWVLSDVHEEPTLVSPTYATPWESAVLRAQSVPKRGDNAGIHALKAEPDMGDYNASYYYTCAVWGRVALSGIVIEGEHGYRGEQAVIRELWLTNPEANPFRDRYAPIELAAMLEQKYQVEVGFTPHRVFDSWKQYLEGVKALRRF